MTDYVDDYGPVVVDAETGRTEMRQIRRPMRPDEQAELDARRAGAAAQAARDSALVQILALEAEVTPRRMREAIITGDNSFISGIEAQIAVLRAQL